MSAKINIPFYGIDRFYKQNADAFNALTCKVFSGGKVLMGQEVEAFENNLSAFIKTKYASTVGSCTDALFFALKAAGVEAGDEVIVTSLSYIASATPVLMVGAVPVFTDISSDTLSMCPIDFSRKITPKTKAVVFVHLYGSFSPLKEIKEIAKAKNLFLIEDVAQSLGAVSDSSQTAGSIGQMSCFSFDPTKIIGAYGTGGAVITNNKELKEKVDMLRFHGKNSKTNQHQILGYNSRISSLQAALLDFQLGMIDRLIERRKKIAAYYNSVFIDIQDLRIVQTEKGCTFHKYILSTSLRNEMEVFLKNKGIATMRHYDKTIFENSLFNKYQHRAEDIKVAHAVKDKLLSLPIYPEMTEEEVVYVAEAVKSFFNSKA